MSVRYEEVNNEYFRVCYRKTNYEPWMYNHPEKVNWEEYKREEITKAEYIQADIGGDSPWNMCEGTGY